MEIKKAIIFLGGDEPSISLIKKETQKEEIIIAADKGAEVLLKNNISFHYLVGDLDSLNDEYLEVIKKKNIEIKRYPKNKNYTDGEIALNFAIDMGAKEVTFLCCTGTRLDHVLGNIALLYQGEKKNVRVKMKDDNNILFLLKEGEHKILGKKDGFFSLIPIKDTKGLYIKDAKYPLENYDLYFGDTRTISNEFMGKDVKVNFKKGMILFCMSKD